MNLSLSFLIFGEDERRCDLEGKERASMDAVEERESSNELNCWSLKKKNRRVQSTLRRELKK